MRIKKQRMSKAGAIALIYRERSRTRIYDRENPTIGIGHLLTPTERKTGVILVKDENNQTVKIFPNQGINKRQIELLFLQDIELRAQELNRYIKVSTTQEQFDALMFFAFNIGTTAFRESRVCAAVNSGATDEYVAAIWTKSFLTSNGKLSRELVDRRRDEAAFWLTKEYAHLSNNRREQTVLAGF